jgi:hypothetical protein
MPHNHTDMRFERMIVEMTKRSDFEDEEGA